MWWWIQIIIVLLLIETIWVVFRKNDEKRNTMLAWLSIAFTLFGIAIAVGDSYLSQYDYKKATIRENVKYKKKGISFSTLIGGLSDTPPHYIFVMDVSKSILSQKIRKTNSIEEQINVINNSGRMSTTRESFGEDSDGMILFSELLKIRLLCLLLQLEDKNNDDIEYTIVRFAGQCSSRKFSVGKKISERIDEAFPLVLSTRFDGNNTDFKILFNHLNEKYIKDIKAENRFDKKDVIIVFLSDYLHDVRKENSDESKKELIESIKLMENKSVNLTLYMLQDNTNQIESGHKNNVINIAGIIQEYLPKTRFTKLDIRHIDEIFYPLVLPTPFPFYYSNSVFERSLKTGIIFDQEQTLSFYLGDSYTNTNRLEFRLHPFGSEKSIRLSRNKNQVHILKGKSSMELFGYIPAPYNCPDIIVEDVSKGAQYIIPVVFYKNLPKTEVCLFVVITLIVIYLFLLLIVKKKNSDQNHESKDQKKEQKKEQENVTTVEFT